MRKIALLFLVLLLTVRLTASMQQLLPGNVTYNSFIPSPENYFGHLPGDRHLSHDQILRYAEELAKLSDRVIVEEYARSHENRPLVHLIFTTPKNHQSLEELKQKHIEFSQSGSKLTSSEVPLVVLLGYGVHGNESSASNAAVVAMYYLAAAQGPAIDELLSNTIVLIDPNMNPDGFTRHSTWVNMHQGLTDVSDPYARGFTETWPGGRGNHYWFDLNRDYLFVVHPESRGRIEKFQEWKPNVVTDHHEMGASSTFFFQPGIPTRNNPLVPEYNYELTNRIADFHRAAFDSRGELYYAEESFDDYYLGKGSSYPDINGSIGILFEQAGYRGKVRETPLGVKTLFDGIRNQLEVTWSTLDAALALREELLMSQRRFYTDAQKLAASDPVKGYIVGVDNDLYRLNVLADILKVHQIEVSSLNETVTRQGVTYQPGKAIVVSLDQPQYRLIKSLFETASQFTDSAFYDVSTWTLPLGLDLHYHAITSGRELRSFAGLPVESLPQPAGGTKGNAATFAWVMHWDQYLAPAVLWELHQLDLLLLAASKPFETYSQHGDLMKFGYGTVVIPVAYQKSIGAIELAQKLDALGRKWGISFYSVDSGYIPNGSDLGSANYTPLTKPRILMVAGESVNSRDAGELWHLFDQRYQIPVTITDISALGRINLNRYTTLILPGGGLQRISAQGVQQIKQWIAAGGTLLGIGDAVVWTNAQEITSVKFKRPVDDAEGVGSVYAERATNAAVHAIGGVILKSELDISHPIGYGFTKADLPVFKTGTRVAELPEGRFAAPVKFASPAWMSGYLSPENRGRLNGAPLVTVHRNGGGRIIHIYEGPNFRGIWMGTNRLVANAIFFGDQIR